MDTNSDNKISKSNFDESQAIFELIQILQYAIEIQSIKELESAIAIWEKKYPVDNFSSTGKSKIKQIKEYLKNIIGKKLAAQMLLERQDVEKKQKFEKNKIAYNELSKIISKAKSSKDFDATLKDISNWKKSNKISDFCKFYKSKVCTLLNESYIDSITEKFSQENARKELNSILDKSKSQKDFNSPKAIEEWIKKYPISDFHPKYKSEIENLTTEAISLTVQFKEFQEAELVKDKENNIVAKMMSMNSTQESAYFELKKILDSNPNDTVSIVNWIYTYRKVKFEGLAREKILLSIMPYYSITLNKDYSIPKTSLNEKISFEEFNNIDNLRRNAIISYFGLILNEQSLSKSSKDNLSNLNKVSMDLTKKITSNNTKESIFEESNDEKEPVTIVDNSFKKKPDIEVPSVKVDILPEDPILEKPKVEETTIKDDSSTIVNTSSKAEPNIEVSSVKVDILPKEHLLEEPKIEETAIKDDSVTVVDNSSEKEPDIEVFSVKVDILPEDPILEKPKVEETTIKDDSSTIVNTSSKAEPNIKVSSVKVDILPKEHLLEEPEIKKSPEDDSNLENLEIIYKKSQQAENLQNLYTDIDSYSLNQKNKSSYFNITKTKTDTY